MRDFAEVVGILILILIIIFACVFLVSLPLALIGWGVATIVGLFTVVNISYWGYVGVGVGTAVVINLLRVLR